MSKTIIISENAIDRLGLRLNHALYKMLRNGDTSLGRNAALPGDPLQFQYDVLKEGMRLASEEMKRVGLEITDNDTMIDKLRHLIREVVDIEAENKPVLEKLCVNCILELFSVPDGVINLNCKIGNPHDSWVAVRLMPEDGDGYEFDDVDDNMLMSSEVEKRRMVDCLIMGASYNLYKYIEDYWKSKIAEIDDRLCDLYDKIDGYERYLLYADNPVLTDDDPMVNAYVAVRLGGDGNRTSIDSVGITFPHLLRETIRGFMELFSSHGLPSDNDRAMAIIKRADFVVAEPWDLRLGIVLWNKFWKTEELGCRVIPHYFKAVCGMDIADFNSFIKEQMLQTKKSRRLMFDVMSEIHHEREKGKFLDRMKKKNLDRSVVDDGDMSVDDLDSMDCDVITEEIIYRKQ